MSSITDEIAVVSCYLDAAAILVMIVLIIMSERFFKRDNPPLRMFRFLRTGMELKKKHTLR